MPALPLHLGWATVRGGLDRIAPIVTRLGQLRRRGRSPEPVPLDAVAQHVTGYAQPIRRARDVPPGFVERFADVLPLDLFDRLP